ncbi:type VII secretion integral membrane protein EccD [Mycobacterium heidelbergense]|uniref:type VII secretion integral membrane protein EccD n=1 Tax=Mycobacterium heidelbergense TaxID=53376 RepID=UPI003CEF23FB
MIVGELPLDVGLPTDASIGALADDVIELANSHLSTQPEPPDVEFDTTEGKWTLARPGAEAFDPHRSLADVNVYDGDVLVIREIGTPCAPLLFDDIDVDDVDTAVADQQRLRGLAHDTPMIGCFAVSMIASLTTGLLLIRHPPAMPVIATALAVGSAGALAGWILGLLAANTRASPWLSAVAIPLIFTGSLHIVPDASQASSLPIAFGLTGLVALVALLTSDLGRSLYTVLVGLSILGTATTVANLLWSPPLRTTGAILATASVIVVYLAPRVTILLSQLPVPPVPTAGEPLDDIETQGGTTVEGVNAVGKQVVPSEEGMIKRIRPSNQYLTGIVAAATIAAAVGSYLAVDVSNGFFWQGTAFAITVATVLCLRGRSHYDLVQSATLIGGGLLTAFALIVKTATHLDGWQINAALALAIVMALIVACGLIAPRLEFSPVMKRQVEILEYLAITMLFPLCFWIIRVYAVFRELRL